MTEPEKDVLPHLGSDGRDRSTAVLRSIAGLVPIAGSVLAEIVTNIIPNQRVDRIEKYLTGLAQRLEEQSARLDDLKTNPEAIAIIEDGAFQAARAITDERLERIVSCVASGLTEKDRSLLAGRQLLDILSELSDLDLSMLLAYDLNSSAAFEKLRPPSAPSGGPNGLEARALWQLSRDKLESFNLLTFRQQTEKVGSFTAYPLFDNWGKRKGTHSISTFGERFLEVVGLKEPRRRHRGGRTPSVDSDGSD